MPQDALTLKYLCKQLNEKFKGGKINKIVQPENEKVVLTIYTGKNTEKLHLDVNPASPKIGVFNSEDSAPILAPNFCMLLRKHIQNATILDISLAIFDRIVKIDLVQKGDFFDEKIKTLYIELMGRYSNIILTEEGKVLGGNRGINFFDNGVRPLIVGKPYVFPPTNEKKQPSDRSLIDDFISQNPSKISQFIFDNIQGLSLITAREIEYRFLLENNNDLSLFKKAEKLFDFINFFIDNTKEKATVYIVDNMAVDVCAFEYESIKGEKLFFDSLICAEGYYFNQVDIEKKFNQKKDRLLGIVHAQIKKIKKKLSTLLAREKDAMSAEENKLKGELLLSNIYKLKKGESLVELENYYDNTIVKINLDENLDISKNAERYYKKYNKQKRTLEALIPQKQQAEKERDYFISVLEEITLVESLEDINLIEKELEKIEVIKTNKPKTKKQEDILGYREYVIEGFIVKAGRNNLENDKLTFTANANDIWVHSKDYHSAHVIIETKGKSIDELPENVIVKACEITAYFSKARGGEKSEVCYTYKKHVKKTPKTKPGFCTYTDFKSIMVYANKNEDLLKNTQKSN